MTNENNRRALAILGYHKIGAPAPGGWETWYYVPGKVFLCHLRLLYDRGWQFIDVTTFLRGLDDPASLPQKSALITFDDGYLSMVTYALPCLRQRECPAVLFVPTDFIGRENIWDQDSEPRELLCDWEDLRELERNGVSIQSHGVSHRWLSQLDMTEQEKELRVSRATLETGLNKPVELLAYPYGDAVTDLDIVRRAGYRAAFVYGGAGGVHIGPIIDPYRITRIAMGPDTDLEAAIEKL